MIRERPSRKKRIPVGDRAFISFINECAVAVDRLMESASDDADSVMSRASLMADEMMSDAWSFRAIETVFQSLPMA